MKKLVLISIILLGALFIYISSHFYRSIKMYTEESALIVVQENLLVLEEAIEKWRNDNDGVFPHAFNDMSKSKRNMFKSYLLKPLEQPYLFTSKNIDKFVHFLDDSLPPNIDALRKPGFIYVFYHNNKYVIVGFGKKKQDLLRSDSEDFIQFYKAYINEYKRIYKK